MVKLPLIFQKNCDVQNINDAGSHIFQYLFTIKEAGSRGYN